MTLFLVLAGAVIALLVITVTLLGSREELEKSDKTEKVKYRYTKRRYLMTLAEHDCYKLLLRGLGDKYFIFAQVHLPQIVTEKMSRQNWTAARWHIDRKSVDFVIASRDTVSPLLAIELDDWSHNREDRQERDREVERILEEADIPLLRITDMENLVARVERKLGATQPQSGHIL
jgi:hypothetical protein